MANNTDSLATEISPPNAMQGCSLGSITAVATRKHTSQTRSHLQMYCELRTMEMYGKLGHRAGFLTTAYG